MKRLRPSLRERKRYLLIQIGEGDLKKDVERIMIEFLGVLGFSKLGMKWIKTDKNKAIVSINREALNEFRAAIAVSPEKIKIEKVSGTLKGLRG